MNKPKGNFSISEDWLAVVIAFALILFAALGVLGKNGIQIIF
ncbi:MAG: hypothetical protein AB1453_05355 [Chloroflexota bacterium]